MSTSTILIIILILLLVGAFPTAGYGTNSHWVGGGLGIILLIFVILLVMGRI